MWLAAVYTKLSFLWLEGKGYNVKETALSEDFLKYLWTK